MQHSIQIGIMIPVLKFSKHARAGWAYRVALVDLLLHNEPIGCGSGHRVKVARHQHGYVRAVGNLLQPLQERVHLQVDSNQSKVPSS